MFKKKAAVRVQVFSGLFKGFPSFNFTFLFHLPLQLAGKFVSFSLFPTPGGGGGGEGSVVMRMASCGMSPKWNRRCGSHTES